MITRAMYYCGWCRDNPTNPCDAHRRGYEAMLELQRASSWPWTLQASSPSWAPIAIAAATTAFVSVVGLIAVVLLLTGAR